MVAFQPLVMALVMGLTAVCAITTCVVTCYMSRKKKMTKNGSEYEVEEDPPTVDVVVIDPPAHREWKSDVVTTCSGMPGVTADNHDDVKDIDDNIEDSENLAVGEKSDDVIDNGNDKHVDPEDNVDDRDKKTDVGEDPDDVKGCGNDKHINAEARAKVTIDTNTDAAAMNNLNSQ